MKFWEAMKALEEGKKVRRIEWKDHQYISKDGDEMGLGFIETIKNYLSQRLLQDKWELYKEPEQLLTFSQVIGGLKNGKYYRRKSWPNESRMFENDGFIIKDGAGTVLMTLEDLEATDWAEVK